MYYQIDQQQIIYIISKNKMYKIIFALLLLIISVTADQNYTQIVNNLKQKIQKDPYKHSAWNRLAQLTDTYGPRMWGSLVLQQAIAWLKNQAIKQGFENIHLQPVSNFKKWVRGKQSLYLLEPRKTKLDVIGLGGSVSSNTSIKADVIVVSDYDQLEKVKDKVAGKIVCFNNKWVDYMTSVTYRVEGPSIAAKYGAIATLVRSVASSSIYSVHTGYMEYNTNVSTTKIPCGAITVEDAQMFARMQERNQTITVNLTLLSQFFDGANSNNLIFQIKGSKFPEQIVLAGGHIDTWDTGSQTGANDDGGGFITVFEAFRLLMKNGYRPQRTLRFIAWSGQQSGSPLDGAAQYLKLHKDEIKNHVAGFESDLGSTQLQGFGYQIPSQEGKAIFMDVLQKYLSILGAGSSENQVFTADIEQMGEQGVPIFDNKIKDTPDHSFYFRYHHSAGDSMSMMNPDQMDSNVVGIASFLFIIADLDKTVRDIIPSPTNLRMQKY